MQGSLNPAPADDSKAALSARMVRVHMITDRQFEHLQGWPERSKDSTGD